MLILAANFVKGGFSTFPLLHQVYNSPMNCFERAETIRRWVTVWRTWGTWEPLCVSTYVMEFFRDLGPGFDEVSATLAALCRALRGERPFVDRSGDPFRRAQLIAEDACFLQGVALAESMGSGGNPLPPEELPGQLLFRI